MKKLYWLIAFLFAAAVANAQSPTAIPSGHLSSQPKLTAQDSIAMYKAGILPRTAPAIFKVIDLRRKHPKEKYILGYVRENKPLDSDKKPLPDYFIIKEALPGKEDNGQTK